MRPDRLDVALTILWWAWMVVTVLLDGWFGRRIEAEEARERTKAGPPPLTVIYPDDRREPPP